MPRNHSKEQIYEQDSEEVLSKTQRKKQVSALQELGESLLSLPKARVKHLKLPEVLLDAVEEYKRLTQREALRRQLQYIGRLMREVDEEGVLAIREQVAIVRGESELHNAFLHRLERWRERLLDHDDALSLWLAEYPHTDVQALRNLIRNARKEKEAQKPPKSFRALFQLLRDTQAQTNSH
jgi:ribosome-associated protein